ncbi:AcrR Transcriptional regulator [Rhabdaerophilaceae bacterium]
MIGTPPPDALRERIIALAAHEIRKIGPKRMAVVHVAAALGMSHANIYRHFSDKAALVDAVLSGWLRGLEQRLAEIADGPDPADDKLERYLTTLSRGYAETWRCDPAIFMLLADPESARVEPGRHRDSIERQVMRIAEEGIATRLFGGSDARWAGQLVLDLAHRFIDPATLACNRESASDARRDRVIRAAIRALIQRR